jgi:hypothetical protein
VAVFFGRISFFFCVGKLEEGRTEKAKAKQKKNQMIFGFLYSLFMVM